VIVKQTSERERRRHPRFPQILDIEACGVPPLTGTAKAKSRAPVLGRAQNLSKGGFCLLSDQPVDLSSLLLCHVAVAEGTPTIPTLMLVRWTRKQKGAEESYLSGLQFVF